MRLRKMCQLGSFIIVFILAGCAPSESAIQTAIAQTSVANYQIEEETRQAVISLYSDCISWKQAEFHIGQEVCIIGRIAYIKMEYDPYGGTNVFYGYFSYFTPSLVLISVGRNVFDDKVCIVAYGAPDENPSGPSMLVYIEGFDYEPHGPYIEEVPDELCKP